MPKLLANGINVHYWQSGNGPHVVMTHGLGGNLAGWHLTLVPELQREYRVTTYDLRGHGRSDAPESGYTVRNMAEDLKGVMDGLGIERAHLVGHSWGGDVSLQFALLYPSRVRSLILVEAGLLGPLADVYRHKEWEGWAYVTETLESLLGQPIPEDKRHDLEFLLNTLVDIRVQYGPSRGQRRDERVVKRVIDVLLPRWRNEEVEGELTIDSLSGLHHPTLLMYESSSIFLKSHDVLRERLVNSKSVILNEATVDGSHIKHFTLMEVPEQLLGHTRSFLESEELEARQQRV
jgi:pimeloyl-ACP methyl ester carboxylesterase